MPPSALRNYPYHILYAPSIDSHGQLVYIQFMVRAILLFLFVYLVYLFVRFFRSLGKALRPPRHPSQSVRGKMVKDEICNTYIPQEEALREVRDGKEYFFCSRECRKAFLDRK